MQSEYGKRRKKASALKKAENRQNEIDRQFVKMYEDRACEKITERDFVMLSSKYQKRTNRTGTADNEPKRRIK